MKKRQKYTYEINVILIVTKDIYINFNLTRYKYLFFYLFNPNTAGFLQVNLFNIDSTKKNNWYIHICIPINLIFNIIFQGYFYNLIILRSVQLDIFIKYFKLICELKYLKFIN